MTTAPAIWTTLGGVLTLQPNAYAVDINAAGGVAIASAVVLLAGFSEAVGQSVVLFANRVRPTRFLFSLLISAILFAFGYAFIVLSTWAISLLPLATHVKLGDIAFAFALSYAPILFAFFGALPYLGVPVLWLLRAWHLLAMIVGFMAVSGVSATWAPFYVGLGWLVLVTVEHTVGKPVAALGTRILQAVAGVDLRDYDVPVETASFTVATGSAPSAGAGQASVSISKQGPSGGKLLPAIVGTLVVLVLGFLVAQSLAPLRHAMFGWTEHVPAVVSVPLDLLWVLVIALVVAGFLAPVETLGWWAGWFGGEIDTGVVDADAVDSRNVDGEATRFVVYLDGIAQSSSTYTPDIETFLDALAPELPKHVRLIRGIMAYSAINRPLDDDPLFSALWKFVEKMRLRNINSLLGMIINLRNVLIVAVSADQRYGPMYNFGIAQIVYNALIENGYRIGQGIPVTLLGYSGGGQMSTACAATLRRAIQAPVDVISLGGVISGACKIIDLEQLYHFVGEKDNIQRLGPIMFPSRWKIAIFSNWNRALRLGRITFIGLGPVGHQVPGGMLDPTARLPDGRTFLRQTLDGVTQILKGRLGTQRPMPAAKTTNYARYAAAAWNQPAYYPLRATVDAARYRPVGAWMGRLILPNLEERATLRGVRFEVHHADDAHADLVGQTVTLRWSDDTAVSQLIHAVTRDVHFSPRAEHSNSTGELVLPVRVNGWQLVDPLESLAGAHPDDDIVVMLAGKVDVAGDADGTVLSIWQQPVQITGRYYALVRFDASAGGDAFTVTHFDATTRTFSGPAETVRLPEVVADAGGRPTFVSAGLWESPLNEAGWYIYGSPDAGGTFVVQALSPRSLLRLEPNRTLPGRKAAREFTRRGAWAEATARRGTTASTLLPNARRAEADPVREWGEGDRALLVHVYGGIGGKAGEQLARTPIYFGHFAYGIAQVVREPLAGELRFDVIYYQVYTHNTDGLIAGALHASRYAGDRQFGWCGLRPLCDILLDFDAFAHEFAVDPAQTRTVIDALRAQLDAMTARYRIGDGSGAVYVGPANNCAQDSNRALFATLRSIQAFVEANPQIVSDQTGHPEAAQHHDALVRLTRSLRRKLQPFGVPRRDWSDNEFDLGTTMGDDPLTSLRNALGSWRVILPRMASDTIVGTFLHHRAAAWVLFSDQIGGPRDDIAPVVPTAF